MRSFCPPGCPLCYANRRGRSSYEGHLYCLGKRREKGFDWRAAMQKPPKGERGHPRSAVDRPDLMLAAYPRLLERLTHDRWDDGSDRVTDTLFLFHDGCRWKVMLKDREAGCVAFVSSDVFQGLLDALEAGLAAGTLDWRADRQAKGRKH